MINRRDFLLYTALLGSMNLYAKNKNSFRVKMEGELDDDLIITRNFYNTEDFKGIDCFQMHNFTGRFEIGSQVVKSTQSPGFIKYDKNIPVDKNSIISIFTCNERVAIHADKKLTYRTHYKSVPLYINNKMMFPSVIPENDDVKNYPTWYAPDEEHMSNYYRIWENAGVFNGFITHELGEHIITLFNKDNVAISTSSVNIVNDEVIQIPFKKILDKEITNKHIFTELDNFVFDGNENRNDIFIANNAAAKILIQNKKGLVSIDLPYYCPYVNTYYIKFKGEEK